MDIKNSMLLANMMSSKGGGGGGIEYLQSDGAIYIPLCESGETLNVKSFKLDIEFLNNPNDKNIYFGTYYTVIGSYKSYGIIGKSDQVPNAITFFDKTSTGQDITSMDRQIIEKSFSTQTTADNTWGIFGGSYSLSFVPVVIGYAICKIWSLICYDENGNEVANLLPKEENGVLGMYDSVRQKFIAGVGSGSFIAG